MMRKTDMPCNLIGIFAHEDDEIIGPGGLLMRNAKQGGKSKVICFGGSSKERSEEFYNACKVLSIEGKLWGYDEGYQNITSKEIQKKLIDELLEFNPDFVITHDKECEYHNDHKTLFDYVMDSTLFALNKKNAPNIKGILTTETHMLFSKYALAVDITDELNYKLEAMKFHKSQLEKSSNYYLDLIEKKAALRGLQSGVKYAEAFKTYDLPIIGNISGRGRAI
ncbi:MAG: PIG-L deacetylase family protein [Candidatus Woesearchaeota archaeon]